MPIKRFLYRLDFCRILVISRIILKRNYDLSNKIDQNLFCKIKSNLFTFTIIFDPFQGASAVVVLLCSCVGDFICDVWFVIICFSSLLLLVPRKDCTSWLWHFLDIFNYIFDNSENLWNWKCNGDILHLTYNCWERVGVINWATK